MSASSIRLGAWFVCLIAELIFWGCGSDSGTTSRWRGRLLTEACGDAAAKRDNFPGSRSISLAPVTVGQICRLFAFWGWVGSRQFRPI
jgi:hypothetical protein